MCGTTTGKPGVAWHRRGRRDVGQVIAENSYSDGNLLPRLFTANRDRISDPDLIQVGQVLRIPFEGP